MAERLDDLTIAGDHTSHGQDTYYLKFQIQKWRQDNPESRTFHWLDICPGDSRILHELSSSSTFDGLDIVYHSLELSDNFNRIANNRCQVLKDKKIIKSYKLHSGELNTLREYFGKFKYDLVTIINCIHTLPLSVIPNLFLNSIDFLDIYSNGQLFIFDICEIPYTEPEPGALAWTQSNTESFVQTISEVMDKNYNLLAPINLGGQAWLLGWNAKSLTNLEDSYTSPSFKTKLSECLLDMYKNRKITINDFVNEQIVKRLDTETTDIDLRTENKVLDSQYRDFWSCDRQINAFVIFLSSEGE